MNITALETVISLWLESKKQVVKEGTYSKYRGIAERFCFALNKTGTEEVSDSSINTYIDNLQHILSSVTVKSVITVIKEILIFAFDKYVSDIPFSCTFPKISTVISETQTLTFSESMKLNNELIKSGKLADICILIALNMGLRIGEICALRWENVDFARKSIFIKGTATRIRNDFSSGENKTKLIVNTPKTLSSKREVPVPDFILKLLKSNRSDDDGIFILSGKSDRIPDPRNLQRQFQTRCKKILGYTINFHALRHTFATLSISNGTDPKTVSKLLGHSTVTTTLNLYRTVSFDDKSNAIASLEKAIGPKKKSKGKEKQDSQINR